MKNLLKSLGLKRRIASALLSLSGTLSLIPGLQGYAALLSELAGIIGGGGLLHALLYGTIGKNKLASFASLVSMLIAISPTIPALAPYQVILQAVLVLLGGAGATLPAKK